MRGFFFGFCGFIVLICFFAALSTHAWVSAIVLGLLIVVMPILYKASKI